MLGSAEMVVIGISAFGVIGCVVATLLAFRSYGKKAKASQWAKEIAVQEPLFDPKDFMSGGGPESMNYPRPGVIWSSQSSSSAATSDVDIQIVREDLVQSCDLLNDAADRLAHINPGTLHVLRLAALSNPSVKERVLERLLRRAAGSSEREQWQKMFEATLEAVHAQFSDLDSPETKHKPQG